LQKVPYRCGLEVKNRRFDLRRFLHTLYSKALWSMKVWATHGGSTSSNPSSLKMTDICIGLKKRGEQKNAFPASSDCVRTKRDHTPLQLIAAISSTCRR